MSQHFVYILQTHHNYYYTGYTTDIQRRLKQHQKGIASKFTRAFGVKKMIYHEIYSTKSSALKREAFIKTLSRQQKEELVKAGKKSKD